MATTKTGTAKKAKKARKAAKKTAKKPAKKRLKKELEEKASRRRGVTAKKKAGVYRDYGNEPTEGNRRKRSTAKKRTTTGTTKKTAGKKSQVRAGASEEPEYRNIERSSREERRWDGDTHEGVWKEEVGVRGGRGDKERYKTRGRDQQAPKKRRLQIRDEEKRRKPRHDLFYYSRPRRRRAAAGSRWRRFYRLDQQGRYFGVNDPNANPFGEHPASAGRAEYLGGNKRHPGLIGRKRRATRSEERRDTTEERSARRRQRRTERSDSREPLTHKTSTKLAIKDYRNRNQYGMSDFHPMQMYDPVEVEHELEEMDDSEFDHMYQDKGYQHAGNTEGFGRRGGRQSYYGWEDEDEYREGHAARKRGYGKYGSR